MMVLADAALAQIDVPYDNGTEEHLDLPGFGVLTNVLSPADCPGGTILSGSDSVPHLCATVMDDSPRYEWSDYDFDSGNHAAPGTCLSLDTVTPADWYTYITRWQLCDDGSIRGDVGAGGTIAPHLDGDPSDGSAVEAGQSGYAVNHFHNIFWRLEFGLTNSVPAALSQVDVSRDKGKFVTTNQPMPQESKAQSADNRFWQVTSPQSNSDAHPIAYDIVLNNSNPYRNVPGHGYTDNDVYLTQYRQCETLAANNNTEPCAGSVDQYVDGDPLTRPIVWLQNSIHHDPRDEDQPIMNEHWIGFMLMPRGLTSDNQLVRP